MPFLRAVFLAWDPPGKDDDAIEGVGALMNSPDSLSESSCLLNRNSRCSSKQTIEKGAGPEEQEQSELPGLERLLRMVRRTYLLFAPFFFGAAFLALGFSEALAFFN
jgi:hypothetical protein